MYYCCLCGYHGFDVEKPVQRAETMTNDNALLIENLYCYKIKQAGASFKMFPPLFCDHSVNFSKPGPQTSRQTIQPSPKML